MKKSALTTVLLVLLSVTCARAQGSDTARQRTRVGRWVHNIYNDAWKSIHKDPSDTTEFIVPPLNNKSEEAFLDYQDKIIRYIVPVRYGFERDFSDTSYRLKDLGARVENALHIDTKHWVISNHMFVREKKPLDPYLVADNERYLRTLPFIQDVRIIPVLVGRNNDSVDLLVITKDFFSIDADVDASGVDRVKVRAAEANFLGMGQRLQVSVLRDQNRHPNWGFETVFNRSSIGGTFITGTVGYSQINTGRSDGGEEEQAVFLRLDRPLVSPNAKVAGALEISHNQSRNVYRKSEADYFNYTYNVYDVWIGYNLNTSNSLLFSNVIRDRKFVALRYINNNFTRLPHQIGPRFDPVYNNKQAILGEITFFRQDFYKTQYIYGFGITEDLPYGYNVAVTGGWYEQRDNNRAYAGIDANKYFTTGRGDFCQWFLRAGSFFFREKFEDAGILGGANLFTRPYHMGRTVLRHQVHANYARQFNRVATERLRLDNAYGLDDFNTDSLQGMQRFSAGVESVLFLPCKPLGFRIAPFAFSNFSLLTPEGRALRHSDGFVSLGGGLRARNESLIFGTLELRATYFPHAVYNIQQFKVELSSNLRFRYQSNYVKAPGVIYMNQ